MVLTRSAQMRLLVAAQFVMFGLQWLNFTRDGHWIALVSNHVALGITLWSWRSFRKTQRES